MNQAYLKWDEKIIRDFADENIALLYNNGYLFGRNGRGVIYQTRSLRLDLSKFSLSSENRRVLKKTDGLKLEVVPLPYPEYHWSIGKLAKDFYETKFGDGVFSANKVKELLTDVEKSNFNRVLVYRESRIRSQELSDTVGYCVAYESKNILHYSYPFYNLENEIPNLGLGMMLRAILYAQESGKKLFYLGSFQRPTDVYKLQFAGLEWFDGERWQTNPEELKKVL